MKSGTRGDRAVKLTLAFDLMHQTLEPYVRKQEDIDIHRAATERTAKPAGLSDRLRWLRNAPPAPPKDIITAIWNLRQIRNRWAHQQPISQRDYESAFREMSIICRHLGATDAVDELNGIKSLSGISQWTAVECRLAAVRAGNTLLRAERRREHEWRRNWATIWTEFVAVATKRAQRDNRRWAHRTAGAIDSALRTSLPYRPD